jgi:tripartite-type tricarboxylate transporter receptor subunit TctC
MLLKRYCPLLAFALIACLAVPICAQERFPAKPIRIVVGFPPGGFADALARTVSPEMAEALGQAVVVENRPGAGGTMAVGLVAKTPPDGHTLILGSPTTIIVAPYAYRELSYQAKDLQPISRIAAVPNLLVVNPSLSVDTVSDLVALAKSRPNQLTYGSGGNGSTQHLAAELFKLMTASELLHVPYKGGAPAMADLVSGQIAMVFEPLNSALSYVNSGRVKALATTSSARSSLLPQVPAVAETVPGYEVSIWVGLLAPAGVPADTVTRLHSAIARAVNLPQVRERLVKQGTQPIGDTPEQFADAIRQESSRWEDLVKRTGLRLN